MDNRNILPSRKISLFVQATGFIFFGILFCICWNFYLERMLSFDGAFNVFRLMQSGKFVCGPGRYGDYIPEILPMLAYKMDFPLHSILLTYSVSFIILHYLVFLFITLFLKNNGAGIAVMLASCLAYYFAFYLPIMELNECIILGILLWAILHPEYPYMNSTQKNLASVGAIATIILMSYFHSLGILFVVFVVGMEIIGAKRYKDWRLWTVTILGIAWYVVRIIKLSRYFGDNQFIPFHEMVAHVSNWRSWPSTQYLSDHTWLYFRGLKWFAIACLLLSLRKGISTFLFFLIFLLLYTFIFLANYQNGTSSFSYESYYIGYGFFVALMFAFIFYHPNRRNMVMILALPLLWIGVVKIYHAHDMYTYRLAYIERIVSAARANGEHKCIIDSKCYPFEYALAPWDVAFETLMYSSLDGRDSAVTVFIKTPEFDRLCDTVMNKHNVFLGAQFSPIWYTSDDMPEEYIKLPSTGYKYLTHTQDDTSFHEGIFSSVNVKITPLIEYLSVKGNNLRTVIPLEIINTSGKIIPSIPRSHDPVCLSYKLYNEKGKVVKEVTDQPLETDVGAQSVQGLEIDYPMNKGVYYAEPGLNTVGKRNWNIPVQRVVITVD